MQKFWMVLIPIILLRMVHEARLQNRAVWVDVQSKNESATTWRAALDLKLQGLQTDHPKELIGFLVSQGLR